MTTPADIAPPPPSEVEAGIDSLVGTDTPGVEAPETHDSPPTPSPTPPSVPAATPAPTPPATPAAAPAKSPESPDTSKLGDDLAALVPKLAEPVAEPKTPKELRAVYDSTKAELAKATARLRELESSTDSIKKAAAEETRKELQKELDTLRKEREELDGRLKLTDYTKSDEYKKQHGEPIVAAWDAAQTALAGVKVVNPDGTERDASLEDIGALCKMSDRDALRAAKEKFGDDMPLAMRHRDRIVDLWTSAQKAIEAYKGQYKQVSEQSAAAKLESINRWSSEMNSLRTEFKDLFGQTGDKEVDELLAKGDTLVRTAMVGDNIPQDVPADQRQAMIFRAQTVVGARAAAFGRQTILLNRANAKIEELTKKLSSYERSEPPVGGDSSDSKPATVKSGVDGIDDLPGLDHP